MIIRELNIRAFGKLENRNLSLDPGLNLVYGPNESGKSSLAAYIYAALYGFPRRSKSLDKDLRRKYQPWHSSAYGGDLIFTNNSRRFMLKRSFASQARADRSQLIDLDLGVEVSLQDQQSPGFEILGLSQEDFLASSFILDRLAGPLDFKRFQAAVAERSLEDYSGDIWQSIKASLEAGRRELKPFRGGGGLITGLELELLDLELKYSTALAEEQKQEGLLKRKQNLEELCSSLEKQLQGLDQAAEQAWAENIISRAKQLDRLEKEAVMQSQAEAQLALVDQGVADLSAQSGISLSVLQLDQFTSLDREFNQAYKQLAEFMDTGAGLKHDLKMKELQVQDLTASLEGRRAQVKGLERELAELDQRLDQAEPAVQKKPVPSGTRLVYLTLLVFMLAGFLLAAKFTSWRIPGLILGGVSALLLSITYSSGIKSLRRNYQDIQAQNQLKSSKYRQILEQRDQVNSLAMEQGWQLKQLVQHKQDLLERLAELEPKISQAEREFKRVKQDYILFLSEILGRQPKDSELGDLYHQVVKTSLNDERAARQRAERERLKSQLLAGLSPAEFRLKLAEAKSRLSQLGAQLDPGQARSTGVEDRPSIEARLNRAKAELAQVERDLALSLSQSDSAASIARELAELNAQLANLEQQLRIYDLALSLGEAAEQDLRQTTTPGLLRQSQTYFSRLSQGRYDSLLQAGPDKIKILTGTDAGYQEEDYFSEGTRDLLFFSLRLAFSDLVQSGQARPSPLILDDPFTRLDQDRKQVAFHFLNEYCQEQARQVILLTADQDYYRSAKQGQVRLIKMAE